MIEFLLVALKNADIQRPIRWLDLACGGGEIINFINLEKLGIHPSEVEFYGIDSSPSEIDWAQHTGKPSRQFICSNVFNMPSHLPKYFDIISSFEFLEHILDPLSFLDSLSTLFNYRFIVCGSPMSQKVSHKYNSIHAWAYSAKGYQFLLEASGHSVILNSQDTIGSFVGGLDWCSCIGTPYRSLKDALNYNFGGSNVIA